MLKLMSVPDHPSLTDCTLIADDYRRIKDRFCAVEIPVNDRVADVALVLGGGGGSGSGAWPC